MKLFLLVLIFSLSIISSAFCLGNDTILLSRSNSSVKFKGYKTEKFWQIAIHGGFFIPVGDYLTESLDNCPSAGAEVAYRLNTEVALYTEIKIYPLSLKDPYGPTASYFESTLGTRFYFRHINYRSSIFFEAGVGTFMYNEGQGITPSKSYSGATTVRLGANAGIGCELVLSNSIFAILKAKMNSIFIPGSSTTFVSGVGGLAFRF